MRAPKFSAILKCGLPRSGEKPFDSFVEKLAADFERRGAFRTLTINGRGRFEWPKEAGIYVIRKRGKRAVLYIGAVGRIADKGDLVTSSTLAQRGCRWTPYHFDKDDKMFRYGPESKGLKARKSHFEKGYLHKVNFSRLVIDCYLVADGDRIAPVAIEALLIQLHLEQFHHLPEANRQF